MSQCQEYYNDTVTRVVQWLNGIMYLVPQESSAFHCLYLVKYYNSNHKSQVILQFCQTQKQHYLDSLLFTTKHMHIYSTRSSCMLDICLNNDFKKQFPNIK